jgi:hypothetical protein
MKLTMRDIVRWFGRCEVVRIEAGSQFCDELPRVTVRFDDADGMYNELRFPAAQDGIPPLGRVFLNSLTDAAESRVDSLGDVPEKAVTT